MASRRQSKEAADNEQLRGLAAVDEVLREPAMADLLERYPRGLAVDAVRAVIQRLRQEILAGEDQTAAANLSAAALVPWVERLLESATRPSLRRVINATGIVVHTNLGRAVLPDEAIAAVITAASGASDLEFDLGSGERATRQRHVRGVLRTLTGAADALVVNNCAAALFLSLAAIARGGEVLVARSQLVEIGDGFRIPDIMREGGATLIEVGTTNRTYVRDFEQAWSERTRAVLRVHTSNYRIVGFTSEPRIDELVTLAHDRGAVVIDDLGSGALAEIDAFADEPRLAESVAAGSDVVTFSGDKLLGGPQAGIAVGAAAAIDALRAHPLARALRIDKLDLAALDAVLRLYLDPAGALVRIPALAALAAEPAVTRARAERLLARLSADDAATARASFALVDSQGRAGAGALPITNIPSTALSVSPSEGSAALLAERLRRGTPAVVARAQDDQVVVDLLAVRDNELDDLAAAIAAALC